MRRPYKAITKDTIARWVKNGMEAAGIDTNRFKPHSIRAASTSAAVKAKVPLQTILNTAGWSSCKTFAKFYNKPVEGVNYGKSLLNASRK